MGIVVARMTDEKYGHCPYWNQRRCAINKNGGVFGGGLSGGEGSFFRKNLGIRF
jgi:hypothetical protein